MPIQVLHSTLEQHSFDHGLNFPFHNGNLLNGNINFAWISLLIVYPLISLISSAQFHQLDHNWKTTEKQ